MKRFAAWVIAGASIAILMTGCQGGPGMPGQPSDIRIVGDFEQSTDGWEPANTAKAEIADLHATSGAKALKVDLPVGPYPGIGIEFKKPADWSACQALRFSVFNASKDTFTLCVRVDDAASKDFGTRYNGDMYPFKLAPGANEVEVTMAALKEGSFLGRGLDTSKIKLVRFFGTVKQPTTLYFDNVRLFCPKPQPSGETVLAAFDSADAAKYVATGGATIGAVPCPPSPNSALSITLPPDGQYPGVNFTSVPPDWLGYQFLCMDINVPKGGIAGLAAKVVDSTGRSQTVSLPLVEGDNKVVVPLEIFAEVSLGKVKTLQLFSGKPAKEEKLLLDNVRLIRLAAVEFPTVRDDKAEDALLRLDLKRFQVPKNTCFMAMAFITLADGTTRIVRCNAPNKGPDAYAIPAAAFEGAAKGKPVSVYVFVSDHGVWGYWPRSYNFDGSKHAEEFVHEVK